MSYLRDVARILKRRFPNLTVDETLELGEQLSTVHAACVDRYAALALRIDRYAALLDGIRGELAVDENATGCGLAFREIRRLVQEFDHA